MKTNYSYMGKMLFVNLTDKKTYTEELSEELARGFLGGYGIGARMIIEKMKKGADPLGPDNILGIGTGPFTGCGVISTSRFITMGKSPLTGYWGDANSGGNFPAALKGAGYDFIFFEGKSEKPVYLLVTDEKVKFRDASHLWGKDTRETEALIRQENGNKSLKIVCIGTAGEKQARIAAIMNDGGRAAARSGLGAVMGSKNVKALACAGSMKPAVYDAGKVKELNKKLLEIITDENNSMTQVLLQTGTPGAMIPHLIGHMTPIKNFKGNHRDDFPEVKWQKVGFEAMEPFIEKKYACTGCPIACGGVLNITKGKHTGSKLHKPEYETMGAFGPNCLVDDMEAIIYANELCNLHGFDTISAGGVLAFAMECYENGLITKNDTDGIELTWGNADAMIAVLKKMCVREGIGDILADGTREAARKIGGRAEEFRMDVGGEYIPMHDPREAPGWGATYVSDPTPGRHTRGGTMFLEEDRVGPEIVEKSKMLGIATSLDRWGIEGKGQAHAVLGAWQHLTNNSGFCLFAEGPVQDFIYPVTGWDASVQDLIQVGMRTSTLLHAFNLREGFKPDDFTMPKRACGDPQFKVGPFKNRTIDFKALRKEYYMAMGFDPDTGKIKKEKIDKLGLSGVVK